MPIYEYKPSQGASCDFCRAGFDRLQKISEAAIGTCPRCQAPVQRVISAPHLAKADATLKVDNLEKHGFTQYKKSDKGVYRKTAGKGPDIITKE